MDVFLCFNKIYGAELPHKRQSVNSVYNKVLKYVSNEGHAFVYTLDLNLEERTTNERFC